MLNIQFCSSLVVWDLELSPLCPLAILFHHIVGNKDVEKLTVLAISAFFIARRVFLSSTTGITQPFIISLSYLYSTWGWNIGSKIRETLLDFVKKKHLTHTYKEKAPTHITLLQGVLGSIDKVGSVCCPYPLVLGGFILLLVVKLKMEKRNDQINTFWYFEFNFNQ